MKRRFTLIGALGVVAAAVLGILGLVAVVRALPGRYAYYLPEPLLVLRERSHSDTLPTPLLSPVAVGSTPTASPEPPTAEPTDSPVPSATALPATEPPATLRKTNSRTLKT